MKRMRVLLLAALPLGVMAQTQDVSAQLGAEQANAAGLQQQLVQLGSRYVQIKQQHDALQQTYSADANAYNANCAGRPVNWGNCPSWRARILGEQQQLGTSVANLEQQARDINAQAGDLNTRLEASDQRIADLQRQQAAFMQLRRAAGASHDATSLANEPAKERSNCQFDTAPPCGSTMAVPKAPDTPPALPAAVLNDPQYKALGGQLALEQRSAARLQARVDRLQATQDKATDPAKRQQLQIDLYHARNSLETEQGRMRVTDIKMKDRMQVVMSTPYIRAAPGAGGAHGS